MMYKGVFLLNGISRKKQSDSSSKQEQKSYYGRYVMVQREFRFEMMYWLYRQSLVTLTWYLPDIERVRATVWVRSQGLLESMFLLLQGKRFYSGFGDCDWYSMLIQEPEKVSKKDTQGSRRRGENFPNQVYGYLETGWGKSLLFVNRLEVRTTMTLLQLFLKTKHPQHRLVAMFTAK